MNNASKVKELVRAELVRENAGSSVGRLARIDAGIDRLSSLSTKLADHIQYLLIEITLHAVEHGDVRPADRMLAELGKSKAVRRDAVVAWLTSQGCMTVVVSIDAEGKKSSSFNLNKERAAFLQVMLKQSNEKDVAQYLRQVGWTDAKKEADPMKPLDLTKLLRGLLARANKVEGDPELAGKSDLHLLEGLRKLVPVASKQTKAA